MDFKELTYVLVLARHQSVTKAAQELYLTQPALTRFLQRLETSVGQPLFTRSGNRLIPTYAGEKYIERAQEILLLKKQLDAEMQDIVQVHRGQLRIGLSIFRSFSLLPNVLPEFTRKYPHVKILVEENDPAFLEEALCRGELDLAFFSLPTRRKEIVTETIRTEELVLLLPPQDPLASQAQRRPGSRYPWLDLGWVKERPFILQKKDQRTRQITDRLFHDYAFTPNVILEIQKHRRVDGADAGRLWLFFHPRYPCGRTAGVSAGAAVFLRRPPAHADPVCRGLPQGRVPAGLCPGFH